VAIRLLRTAAPGGDHQLAWAQMLGWTATGQFDLLAGLLDGSEAVEGMAIDTGLRWPLLQRLASMGRAGDARRLAPAPCPCSRENSRSGYLTSSLVTAWPISIRWISLVPTIATFWNPAPGPACSLSARLEHWDEARPWLVVRVITAAVVQHELLGRDVDATAVGIEVHEHPA
jgi:hypothetical protein